MFNCEGPFIILQKISHKCNVHCRYPGWSGCNSTFMDVRDCFDICNDIF